MLYNNWCVVIKTGVDIVYLPRFKETLRRGGEAFLKRVFLEDELVHLELVHLEGGIALHLRGVIVEHLAGVFAAKEAVIKALNLPTDSWHSIKVSNSPSGQPKVQILNFQLSTLNSSLSISHDGNYVIAQFVALIK